MRILILTLFIVPDLAAACDQAGLGKVAEAIGAMQLKHQSEMTARGLSEMCPAWPASIRTGLAAMAQVEPRMRVTLEAKAIAEAPAAWNAACAGGLQAIAAAVRLGVEQRRPHLFDACKLERYGFATRAEYGLSTGPALLTVVVAHLLQADAIDAKRRRAIVRAFAGIAGKAERDAARKARGALPAPPKIPAMN